MQKPPITIVDQAWICADAFVGPGVIIGEGAVVGARAVVMKDVGLGLWWPEIRHDLLNNGYLSNMKNKIEWTPALAKNMIEKARNP